MSTPRISVLVRSIGRATLEQALDSVDAQGLPVRVLVVQAGGERPIELARPSGPVAVQLLRPPQPLTRSAAANLLLQHADTEFALFLDDDDWLLPGHLSRLLQALDEHPSAPAAHAGVVCRTGDRAAAQDLHVYDEPAPWPAMQLGNRLPIHAVLFRTAALAAPPALRFDVGLQQFEDWDFWLQLMHRAGEFVHVPGVSAVYFIDAATGSGHAEQANPARRAHLQAFGRRQLQRWQPADVALLVEHQAGLVGDLATARQQRDAQHAQREQALQACHATQLELARVMHELVLQRAAAEHAQAEHRQLREQHERVLAEQTALQRTLAAYRAEADLLAGVRVDQLRQIERLNGNLQALYASNSWRITRPLRLLSRAWIALRSGRLRTLCRNTALAVRQESRRHGMLGFVQRTPHYLRHARQFARVLAVRPPQAQPDPFAAEQRPLERAAIRLHPELGPEPAALDAAVSIVIPTLNAGAEFVWLLRKLKAQRAVRGVEVVVVDSGSSDGTVALAREMGAVVIEITAAEFTHSHARNLGAQAASGGWLLFMVQDAYPIGDLWLHGMLSYLLEHAAEGVVAASCSEFNRSDSDLMYDCAIATHYRFLGCHEADRIGQHRGDDHMALRSQGQLSDVACLIPRPLFLSYRYRGDYAEDLDLGIRLLRDGHKVAMLASVKVIHSHNRPPYYYLKRSFVDVIFLVGLFDDFHRPACESMRGLVRGAGRVASALAAWLDQAARLPDGVLMHVEVERWLQTMAQEPPSDDPATVCGVGDARFDACLQSLQQAIKAVVGEGAAETREARHFVDSFVARTRHLLQFMASVYGPADAALRMEVADALRKTLAATLGAALAFCYLDREAAPLQGAPRSIIEGLYEQLKQGV